MQTTDDRTVTFPLLPRPLAWPFAILPEGLHGMAVVTALNRIFADALREGGLDFLEGRIMHVRVDDMGVTFHLSLRQGRLATARREREPDLSITGNLHAFLLLAARREDTDTLFFQRRLQMTGDTELGLEVKNFLDGLDLESQGLLRQLSRVMRNTLPVYERLFS